MATSRTGTTKWMRIVRERRALDRRAGITRCPMCGRLLDWDAKRVRGQAHNPARVEVDHIVPHEHGGQDTLENSRCICADCNLKRRGREAKAGRLVILLCGPPGAGKTTAARASGLPVFDRDDPQWASEAQFRAVLRKLAAQPGAQAVVIRAGASSSARRSAAQLTGATHTYLITAPRDELKRRLIERRRDDWRGTLLGVDRWHEQHDRDDGVLDFPGWDAISLGGATREAWPEAVHSPIW
jgi:hypothetical protein